MDKETKLERKFLYFFKQNVKSVFEKIREKLQNSSYKNYEKILEELEKKIPISDGREKELESYKIMKKILEQKIEKEQNLTLFEKKLKRTAINVLFKNEHYEHFRLNPTDYIFSTFYLSLSSLVFLYRLIKEANKRVEKMKEYLNDAEKVKKIKSEVDKEIDKLIDKLYQNSKIEIKEAKKVLLKACLIDENLEIDELAKKYLKITKEQEEIIKKEAKKFLESEDQNLDFDIIQILEERQEVRKALQPKRVLRRGK